MPLPTLQEIIDPHPLMVAPHTLLLDALGKMYRDEINYCSLDSSQTETQNDKIVLPVKYYDYILIAEENKLRGIITERDIIRLIASKKIKTDITVREVVQHNIIFLKDTQYENILGVIVLLRQNKMRHLPVTDEQDNLLGIITPKTLKIGLDKLQILPRIPLSEILQSRLIFASPYTSLLTLANLIIKNKISSILIAQDQQDLLGIVTEKDLIKFYLLGLKLKDHKALEIMSFPLVSIEQNKNLAQAQETMQHYGIRHLIVRDAQDETLGILTEGDIIRSLDVISLYHIIENQQQEVKQLKEEKIQLLQQKNQELEIIVNKRTTNIERQAECNRLLAEISFQIQQSIKLSEIINNTVDKIRQYLQFDRVIVYHFYSKNYGSVIGESVGENQPSLLGKKISNRQLNQEIIKLCKKGSIHFLSDKETDKLSPYCLDLLEQIKAKSCLLVPILQDSYLWGILMANNCYNNKDWEELEISCLKNVATKLAIALKQWSLLENVQSELIKRQKTEKKLSLLAKEQAVIAQLSQQALADTDLDKLMKKAVSLVASTLQVPYSLILEIMPNQAAFLLKAGIGWQDDLMGRARITIEPKNQAGYTLSVGQPVIVKDLRIETRFSGSALLHNHGIISGVTVIIHGKQIPFGILGVYTNKQHKFNQNDVNFLQSIANVIATAVERKQAEEDLNYFFDLSLDIFVIAGIDYYFKRINNRLQEVLGYTEEELLEYSFLKFVHPEDLEQTIAEIDNTILGLPMINFENRYICKDGSYRWLSWSGLSINDLIYCAARDVTERKEMELSLQQLNEQLEQRVEQRTSELQATTLRLVKLIESLESGVLITDEYQKVFLINQAFCNIFKINEKPTKLIGVDFVDFYDNYKILFANSEQAVIRSKEITSNKVPVYSDEILFADGRVFEREYLPIFLGYNFLGNVWMYRDITVKKQATEKVLKALEKEKELNELKSRFITTTSHEFRTPLAIISSSASLLQSYGEKLAQDKQQKYLQRINSSVNHMVQLLEDVLTINRAEADKLKFIPETIELVKFCHELTEQMQQTTEKNELIFKTDNICNLEANIDAKLLQKILTNLLSNSIKYSPEGGKVELELTKTATAVSFIIQDHGIGIPAEDQDKLFDTFHRGKNVNTIPGTGLGLSIVKKCVELHQGSITFTSYMGEGTIFTVTLPLKPPKP